MNRLVVLLVASLLSAGMPITSAQNAAQAEKLLASAQRKATVDGDLKGAIEEFRKVVAAAGGNRALAAQALLRMAECHQKLGDLEAQAIYERLVRDYADQKDAATLARARLGVNPAVARVKGDRAVWSGPRADGFGTISPDARFLSYTDWATGGLMLRDLTAGSDHRLTTGTYDEGSTQFSAISKDGKQIAYQWMDSKAPADGFRYELRVAKLHGTGMSESRRLFDNPDVTGTAPYDWSPDGKWIAVAVERKNFTSQIGLVGVPDGTLRVLKSVDLKGPTKILFSPDGRYIAYDLMAADKSDERHVHVMAVDSTRETTVVADTSHNIIMGWSPDGRHVLFSSNRSGSFGLWAQPLADGKPSGTPTLVKPDTSSIWSLGLTASGTMYVWKYASPIYVGAAAIDLTTGKIVPGPSAPFQRFIGTRGRPGWSADGRHLAYQSCAPTGGGPCVLWIRSMETGQLRELPIKLAYFFFPSWSPDGRELLTRGTDLQGRQGLFRIDTQTGEITLVVSPYPGSSIAQWAVDGKHVYYRRDSSIIERDLASGTEREAVRPVAGGGWFEVSPDGRHLAYQAEAPTGGRDLFVMPLAGGSPRLLLRVNAPEQLHARFDWTSDGSALAIAKLRGETGRKELWLIPVTGEKPRKLDIDVDHWLLDEGGFRLDRAGKQIAFVAAAGKPGLEIRALENFLPEPAAARPSAKNAKK